MSLIHYQELDDKANPGLYAGMTFREYAKRLTTEYPRWKPVIVAASNAGKPIGLGLAQPEGCMGHAELLSLWVETEYRHSGIATELLRRVEQICRDRGVLTLSVDYLYVKDGSPAFERVLAKRDFSQPFQKMLAMRCSLESIQTAPWFRQYKLPKHFSILPWVDLTETERKQICQSNAGSPWIPDDLVPFSFEAGIEPITSLALLVRGEVRGWVINHLVDGILRFTCSYMHPEQQRLGRILLLYNEAIRRFSLINVSVGMWAVPLKHEKMAAFSRRWFKPYSISFNQILSAQKLLPAANS